MRISSILCLCSCALLIGCGPGPEPDFIVGEDQAANVVLKYMRAVETGDFDRAEEFLYEKCDYILKDLEHCRDVFFTFEPSGMKVLSVSHENYGGEWHIRVDLVVNYGEKIKHLRFTVVGGEPPLLRALNPVTY